MGIFRFLKEADDREEEVFERTLVIRSLTAEAEHLESVSEDPKIQRETKKVYEAFRYSDPMASPAFEETDLAIQRQFAAFKSDVENGDAEMASADSGELLRLIDKRNILCRESK